MIIIMNSRAIRRAFDLMYFGKIIVVIKKIVVTTITCVEGKDGSPEPFGRVATIISLSKTKYVITIKINGNNIQRSWISTFLIDLRVIHWYRPRIAKIAKVMIDIAKIIFVINSHCIIVLL